MECLFDAAEVERMKQRVMRLGPQSERQWGKMTAPQMMAHCTVSVQMALGEVKPPRAMMGRILGPVIKPMALKDGEPMRRNSPTAAQLLVSDERELVAEQQKLCAMIERFSAAGPKGCTDHPHAFFGALTPQEWSKLMHKHLDHHLRQFGV